MYKSDKKAFKSAILFSDLRIPTLLDITNSWDDVNKCDDYNTNLSNF